jgi:hypothetical protein
MPARRLAIAVALAAVAFAAAAPAAAQGIQPAPNVPYPANIDYPSGGYGDFSSTVLGEPYVQGVDINLDWSSVETADSPKPVYDWTGLNKVADAAYDQGKHIILVVRAANETGGTTGSTCMPDSAQILPSWEISNLEKQTEANGTDGIYCDSDLETIVPDWFSSVFQNDWLTFINALGQYVSQQPYYSYISYVRIGVGLGGEAFPVMPNGVGSGCDPSDPADSTPPCQQDETADEAWMEDNWGYSAQNWENFQESMLASYDADFPGVGTNGLVVPPPPLIYPIDAQETISGHENPVDYEVADWATSTYSNIGIGSEGLKPNGITATYADWDNLLPMVFANNPDLYVQFQTDSATTTKAEEDGTITVAELYGGRSIEWYESIWTGTGTSLAPPDQAAMTSYQTWVNNNCDPGCPAPSTPGIGDYAPSSGAVGTTVTITGQNLADAAGIAFNGTPAIIESATATQIVTQVPADATTGPITVTNPDGTTTSPASFTVTS